MKYARPEFERRFLLKEVPTGEVVRRVEIHDRYIEGTRLRLRRVSPDTYKLTQKADGFVTTIYLSEAEYEVFAKLPARTIEKTRLSIPPFGVDVFPDGLVLAEVEFDSQEAMNAFVPPPFCVREVTDDWSYAGANLAK